MKKSMNIQKNSLLQIYVMKSDKKQGSLKLVK